MERRPPHLLMQSLFDATQSEEQVDEKQDDLLKETPLPKSTDGPATAPEQQRSPPQKSNSAAALADLRKKQGASGTASEGDLTVKESRATGRSHCCQGLEHALRLACLQEIVA